MAAVELGSGGWGIFGEDVDVLGERRKEAW